MSWEVVDAVRESISSCSFQMYYNKSMKYDLILLSRFNVEILQKE